MYRTDGLKKTKLPVQNSLTVDPTARLIMRQRLVLSSCKKFLEQLKDKGMGLTFSERIACNLLLDSIERLDNS